MEKFRAIIVQFSNRFDLDYLNKVMKLRDLIPLRTNYFVLAVEPQHTEADLHWQMNITQMNMEKCFLSLLVCRHTYYRYCTWALRMLGLQWDRVWKQLHTNYLQLADKGLLLVLEDIHYFWLGDKDLLLLLVLEDIHYLQLGDKDLLLLLEDIQLLLPKDNRLTLIGKPLPKDMLWRCMHL